MALNDDVPCAVAGLIPHAPPMLVVDRIIDIDEVGGSGTVEAVVPDTGLFVTEEGFLDHVAYVELIAQAFAALQGLAARRTGLSLDKGFLVGARDVRVHASARAGDVLAVRVRTAGSLDGFAMIEGEALLGDRLLAAGRLKVFSPPPPATGEGS